MIKQFVFLLFLFTIKQLPAQKTGREFVDSLVFSLKETKDDTAKARLYNRIFNELSNISSAEAMLYAREGLAHTKKMNWPKGIGVFEDNLGRAFSNAGQYDSTIFYYNDALKIHTSAGDQYNTAISYNNLGSAEQNIHSNYTQAIHYYYKALEVAEKIKDSSLLSLTNYNIGGIYLVQENYDKALEFHNRALLIREKKDWPYEIASSLETIGKIYFSLDNIPKASEYFKRALPLYEAAGTSAGLASIWSSLSLTYGKNYRAIVEARIKSKNIWDEVNPMHPDAITNTGNLGIAYLDIVRYDSSNLAKYGDVIPGDKNTLLQKAENYIKAAIDLSTQTGAIESLSYFTGALAEVQEYKGDFKNAYYNYKQYAEIQDSIFSQENKNKIAAAESRLILANQRKAMWALVGGLALVCIIGLLLYRQSRLRKKTNQALLQLNNALDNANKVKIKFFGILSHDLRSPVSKLINFLHLQKNNPELLNPQQTEEHNKKITASAETLLENMETMLLWSKSQMENFKPSKKSILVKDILEKLQRTFISQDRVQFIFRDTGTLTITTDEDYLFSILYNLINNATEALQNTSQPVIECSAFKENNAILFSVSDNGPGFPVSLLQNQGNEKESVSGKKGLGLFIVYDMARAIDGKITLSNHAAGARAVLQLSIP